MKKDIKWLKEEVGELNLVDTVFEADGVSYIDTAVSVMQVYDLIDQLDELEVLSQELPVIPKYVADWIKEEQGIISNWKLPSRFISDNKYKKDQRRYKWSQVEGNMDKFMSALINSYEVAEEPLYYALVKGHELIDTGRVYWDYDKSDNSVFISELYSLHDNFLTEMGKEEWNELGINDSNADFVKVDK